MDASQLSMTRKPGMKPFRMEDIRFNETIIKALELNNFHCDRKRRRDIAKKYKMNWKVYLAIQKEFRRRIFLKLDIMTGKQLEQQNG